MAIPFLSGLEIATGTHNEITFTGTGGAKILAPVEMYLDASNDIYLMSHSSVNLTLGDNTATFAGDVTADGGNMTVKNTGTGNAYLRAYATGTGAAGLYIDAVNGDAAGSDYFSLRQLDNKAIEFNARSGTGNTVFYSKGSLNLTMDGANSTFAGGVTYAGTLTSTGSTTVPAYFRSTANVSYIQLQNSSTGTNGTSDGLTVGVNGTSAYVWNREPVSYTHLTLPTIA